MRDGDGHHHGADDRGRRHRAGDGPGGAAEPDGAGRRDGGRGRGHGHGGGRGGGRGGGSRGGGRGGGRRGDLRAAVLSLLAERPMHGYEMLGELDGRTSGLWRPSPGSLYPALQLLEDQELVQSVDAGGRRRYELTEAGRAEQAAAPASPSPWEAVIGAADQGEVALHGLLRQVTAAADQVAEVGTEAQKASAEALLAGLRRQLYLLLAGSPADGAAAAAPAPPGPETWTRAEDYLDGALIAWDSGLEQARRASQVAGLPDISVSPSQGKLLYLLARTASARRVLEIGTLGGYSTIWLARALPADGQVISLELDARHAEVARASVAASGLAERVDIRTGPALDSLAVLGAADTESFDLVFIDADKESSAEYFAWALRLTRPGSLIIVDNVVRSGRVADADSDNRSVQGVRAMIEAMGAEDRVEVTAIQTVGSKGYDGLAIGLVT